MILADGLNWHRVLSQSDPETGGECVSYRCVEHRRVLWMRQRPHRDAEWVTTYSVDGIAAQYYASADEAIQAMEGNP